MKKFALGGKKCKSTILPEKNSAIVLGLNAAGLCYPDYGLFLARYPGGGGGGGGVFLSHALLGHFL